MVSSTSFLLFSQYLSFTCSRAEWCMESWGQSALTSMVAVSFSGLKSSKDYSFGHQESIVPAPRPIGASVAVTGALGWIHKVSDPLGIICKGDSNVVAK